MERSRVVNVRHVKDGGYVYIGRAHPGIFRDAPRDGQERPGVAFRGHAASPFANPFSHTSRLHWIVPVATAQEAVDQFRNLLLGDPATLARYPRLIPRRMQMLAALPALKACLDAGKPLGCWCVDHNGNGPCHGHVLIEVIEGPDYGRLIAEATT